MFHRWFAVPALLALPAALLAAAPPAEPAPARNVILVMTDGFRWQETFNGIDAALLTKENGHVDDATALRRDFWRETPQARREALLPFLWQVIARRGQIYGNPALGSEARVTNHMYFSYPGYSETLCGYADDARIHSNDKIPNPNVTVLEWLNAKPAYAGRVAAFGAWDAFPAIINAPRAGVLVNAGSDPLTAAPVTPALALLNRLKVETAVIDGEALDALTFHTAIEYVKLHKPRVLFLSLGETDEWAHQGEYELYVRAAHRVDAYLRELWELVESMPEYRGKTSLIVTVDHGRGQAPLGWKSHGESVPDSKYIWMALMGPSTPALGERANVAPVTQSQIAATLAALLGEDYHAAVPQSGAPIADALKQ
jgi:hypothetical protein